MNFLMHTGKAESFDPVFSLMEQAFPPCERREPGRPASCGKHRPTAIAFWKTNRGTFWDFWQCGILAASDLRSTLPSTRKPGAWASVPRHCGAGWKKRDTPAVLEVEFPETDIARRRIGFYQRLALFSMNSPICSPHAVRAAAGSPENHELARSLSESEFEPMKQTIYAQCME